MIYPNWSAYKILLRNKLSLLFSYCLFLHHQNMLYYRIYSDLPLKNFSIIIYATICRYFFSHQNGTKIILYTNPFSFYLSFYPILIWKIYIMPLCLILNTIQYNNGISLWKTTLFKLYIQRVFILIRTWGRFCLVFRVCFWGIILGILHENIPKDNMQKNKNFILKILVSKNNIL